MTSITSNRTALMLAFAFVLCTGVRDGLLAQVDDESADSPIYEAQFNNTSLELVMAEYGDLTGRTALIAPDAKANVTLKSQTLLTKSEYIGAMESILSMHGIALIPQGDKFVKVVKAAEGRKFGMETEMAAGADVPLDADTLISRVIALKHMELNEATKVIDGLKSKNANIQPLTRINGILITDSAINVARILEILEQIDQPIETKEELFVHPVRYGKASEVKGKLEEIIKDLMPEEQAAATVAKSRTSGPPGVIRAMPMDVAGPGPSDVEVEKGIIRGKVKIVADDRTGILIFITMPSNMKFFENVMKALDVETAPDVFVKVFRLEFADADVIAGMLNTLIGAKVGKDSGAPAVPGADKEAKGIALNEYVQKKEEANDVGKSKIGELSADNIKILPDKRTNSLIVMARKGDLVTIEEIVQDMDRMLSQVLIEAVIVEVKLSDSLQTGMDWVQHSMLGYKRGDPTRTPVMALTGRGGGGMLSPEGATGVPSYPVGGGLSYYFTHFGLNLDMVIQAASSDDRSRVLSAPVILTTDNTEAKITSTEQIYVYSGKKYATDGTIVGDDYKTKDVGLELTVKPHINENKVVMMEISQSMSEPGTVGEPQSGARVSSTRTLNASIAVGDRETVVLGGQVRQNRRKERAKIPLLGDIPLLGRLFNYTLDSGGRTEMIVFVTPYVLDTPDEIAAEATRRKRALDIEGIWKKGWSDSQLAEPTWKQRQEERKERIESKRDEKRETVKRLKAEEAERARLEATRREWALETEAERIEAILREQSEKDGNSGAIGDDIMEWMKERENQLRPSIEAAERISPDRPL